jgi:hypothetical protein
MLSEKNFKNCPLNRENKTVSSIQCQWTGTQFEFVELVYAIHDAGSINSGNINLKEMFSIMGEFFNFRVTDYYRFFTNITNRTGERTLYLDKLKKAFMHHLSKSDMR